VRRGRQEGRPELCGILAVLGLAELSGALGLLRVEWQEMKLGARPL
jgi:hypothetical protein